MPQKLIFLHLLTRQSLPNNYPLFFEHKQLFPSSTVNILGLSFSHNLNWKSHISSITKSAYSSLGVLYRLQHFFSPQQMLTIYKGLVRSCMEYASHIWGEINPYRVESKAFRLIGSPLTGCLLRLKSRRSVASLSIFIAIFMLTALRNLLTACLPPSCGFSTLGFPLLLTPILSKPLMQESTSTFVLSSHITGHLWNRQPMSVFLPSYDLQHFKREVSRHLGF